MAIEHDYFGLIGDYWSERKEYGDQDVEVVLDADGDAVSSASLDVAATMVGELELIDDEVRSVLRRPAGLEPEPGHALPPRRAGGRGFRLGRGGDLP